MSQHLHFGSALSPPPPRAGIAPPPPGLHLRAPGRPGCDSENWTEQAQSSRPVFVAAPSCNLESPPLPGRERRAATGLAVSIAAESSGSFHRAKRAGGTGTPRGFLPTWESSIPEAQGWRRGVGDAYFFLKLNQIIVFKPVVLVLCSIKIHRSNPDSGTYSQVSAARAAIVKQTGACGLT